MFRFGFPFRFGFLPLSFPSHSPSPSPSPSPPFQKNLEYIVHVDVDKKEVERDDLNGSIVRSDCDQQLMLDN